MGLRELANRYLAIAALTVALVVTLGLVTGSGTVAARDVLARVGVIAAFAVFWAVQASRAAREVLQSC